MDERANEDIREYLKERGVKMWQVAGKIGISAYKMSRAMKSPLTSNKREQVLRLADEIAVENLNRGDW